MLGLAGYLPTHLIRLMGAVVCAIPELVLQALEPNTSSTQGRSTDRPHREHVGMSQPRTCLFCAVAGGSNEHIIAKWIGRLFSQGAPPGSTYVFRHHSAHPEVGIGPREKTAKQPAYKTRAFCKSCNNGWMSQLEERGRPILEPLALGRARTLSTADQEALAFWATKTLFGFQSIEHPSSKWARAEDYAALYRLQAPLPYSQVWIGATEPRGVAWQRAHHFRFNEASQSIDGFGATLTIGHAVFYVLIGYAGRVGLRLRYEAAFALKEIWPGASAELEWPPVTRLPTLPDTGVTKLVVENGITLPGRA